MNKIKPPPTIVWSTNTIDLDDPFERRWFIRQVLVNGRSQDIRSLDLDEVARLLDDLHLPPDLDNLWRRFLEMRHAGR
jgi:hypothetical protein